MTLRVSSTVTFFILAAAACSSGNSAPRNPDAGANALCSNPPVVSAQTATYCSSCASGGGPTSCSVARPVNVCCTWVEAPGAALVRSTNLHEFSGPDPSPDDACLTSPAAGGKPQMVTVSGHVKLYSAGLDSAGVKVEILTEGANGTPGTVVGTAYATTPDDLTDPPLAVEWPLKCQTGSGSGCKYRSFTYPSVPTETRLIIHTSDATGSGSWADAYEYNVYFSNAEVMGGEVRYDPLAVFAGDMATVASQAGGFHADPALGMILGEVHDCSNARVSGALVDTDVAHEGPMTYFSNDEANAIPDPERVPLGLGTSIVGRFGALNVQTGAPVRVTAVGEMRGQLELLGTYTVQAFPKSVTVLNLRGRRPWQL